VFEEGWKIILSVSDDVQVAFLVAYPKEKKLGIFFYQFLYIKINTYKNKLFLLELNDTY
jgi:hypothetical protein